MKNGVLIVILGSIVYYTARYERTHMATAQNLFIENFLYADISNEAMIQKCVRYIRSLVAQSIIFKQFLVFLIDLFLIYNL